MQSAVRGRWAGAAIFQPNGFAHALIEIRQDLIADSKGALAWAERLAPIVDAIDRRPDIHQVKMFGSRTGPL